MSHRRITYGELRSKEVINTSDGSRLGCITDMELDPEQGVVLSIIVPGPTRFLGFLRGDKDLVVPYCKIKKIGDDVILVDIDCPPPRPAHV